MMRMNTSSFDDFTTPHRRADDDHVADEHAWETYLNTGPISRFFPVTFPTGVVVGAPRLRCSLCQRELEDVRGRVRKTAAAAVIESAAMCPDCNDVTGCDVRIRPWGALESLHGHGVRSYAESVHVPALVRDPATGEVVTVQPYLRAEPGESGEPQPARPSPLRRIGHWVAGWFWRIGR